MWEALLTQSICMAQLKLNLSYDEKKDNLDSLFDNIDNAVYAYCQTL